MVMKRERLTIKQKIQKKIEFRHKQTVFIGKGEEKKMNEGDRLRIYGIPNKQNASIIDVKLLSNEERTKLRAGTNDNNYIEYPLKDYGKYIKSEFVDYDVLIYISSYNRYEKLMRILSQIHTQKTKYSFKLIVMNDGSTDKRYKNIKFVFSNILFLKNKINGGRALYWKTTNTIFQEIKKYNAYAVIQIDDDFVLCNNFINKLMNEFFRLKELSNTYMGIRYHIPMYRENEIINDDVFDKTKNFQGLDGGSLFDMQFFKLIDYKIDNINPIIFRQKFQHSQVWSSLNNLIKKHGVEVYKTRESFAFHDGNEDSKMHSELRLKKKIYTSRFADDIRNNK
jgi:hypothetical protein